MSLHKTFTGTPSPSKKNIVTVLVLAALLVGVIYLAKVADYRASVNAIDIEEVDLMTLSDGTYVGSCDVGFIRAKMQVFIENHAITKVEILEHYNDRGQAAERITDDIVREQRLDVDAVSGATNSSKVIKKACENALRGMCIG